MPNGGGYEDRIAAVLNGAFANSRKLSDGRRLPSGGEVRLVARDTTPHSGGGYTLDRLKYRVVSAAFEHLTDSERTSLLHEVLLDGAWTPSQPAYLGNRL